MLTCKRLISPAGRRVVLAAIATLALATPQTPVLAASPAPAPKDASVATLSPEVTDFSAVRRRYYRRGNAAGAAFMGMTMGLVAGAIAEQQRRDYYENYGYYYGPRPYYAPRPYYGPRYYYSPY